MYIVPIKTYKGVHARKARKQSEKNCAQCVCKLP